MFWCKASSDICKVGHTSKVTPAQLKRMSTRPSRASAARGGIDVVPAGNVDRLHRHLAQRCQCGLRLGQTGEIAAPQLDCRAGAQKALCAGITNAAAASSHHGHPARKIDLVHLALPHTRRSGRRRLQCSTYVYEPPLG